MKVNPNVTIRTISGSSGLKEFFIPVLMFGRPMSNLFFDECGFKHYALFFNDTYIGHYANEVNKLEAFCNWLDNTRIFRDEISSLRQLVRQC